MGEENRIATYEISIEELILFANRYNYTKTDIEELTIREKYAMLDSDMATYMLEINHYQDMVKFGKLGAWLLNSLGAEIENLEELIGECPDYEEISNRKRKLSEDDLEIIKMANELGLSYKKTSKGIKLLS